MAGTWDNFKEDVRSAANIADVVSSYVTLQKKGGKLWGCCPFHGEKTPSFAVDEAKQMFYCFGCHEGGDVFKFIMKQERVDFSGALKLLAGRYNIPVPEREKTQAELQREKENEVIYTANETAGRFYHAALTMTEYGKNALAYLAGRGIGSDIIEKFSIGYALNDFQRLINSLKKRGINEEQLLRAGLVLKNEKGRYYDKFRNRVMIPIKNPRGRIVGFGGRVLDDSLPKYLNTGETKWFNKRRLLFGMDIALGYIRRAERAIVVEGYMDAISLHAGGVENVVASLGTAFTEEQAVMLRRVCPEVVFCYDSDKAGRNASIRAVGIARKAGLRVYVAGVPDGKDPDEYIRAHGKEAYLQVIAAAQDGLSFQISQTVAQFDTSNLTGKVEAVTSIIPFLSECSNAIEVADHIRNLAQQLSIDEQLINTEYQKAVRRGNRTSIPPQEVKAQEQKKQKSSISAAEEMLLAVLLKEPQYIGLADEIIAATGFSDESYAMIYQLILEQGPISDFYVKLDQTSASLLAGIQSLVIPDSEGERVLADCLKQLQRNWLEREYELHSRLAKEYMSTNDERFMEELTESQRIQHEINKL